MGCVYEYTQSNEHTMSLTATGRRRPNEREPKTIRARATTSDVVKISRKTCRCCAARDFSDSRLADSRSARIQNAHTYKQSTAVLVESPRERERGRYIGTQTEQRERASKSLVVVLGYWVGRRRDHRSDTSAGIAYDPTPRESALLVCNNCDCTVQLLIVGASRA